MSDLLNAALSVLTGGTQPEPIDWEAKGAADNQWATRRMEELRRTQPQKEEK